MLRRIRRPSPAMIVACFALLVALGGTSIAAVKLAPRNSVGTFQVIDHSLRSVDFRTPPKGPAGARGPAGPAGPAGAAGPAGPKGDSATGMWAVVDQTGTLIRNKGVASALRLANGQYQVVFNQDVTGCNYQATVGGPGNAIAIGWASVAQRVNVNAGVEVWTYNVGNTNTDRPFYLAVFCS